MGVCREHCIKFSRLVCVFMLYSLTTRLSLFLIYENREYILPDYSQDLYLQFLGVWVISIFFSFAVKTKYKYPNKNELSSLIGFHLGLLLARAIYPEDGNQRRLRKIFVDKFLEYQQEYQRVPKVSANEARVLPIQNRLWDKLQQSFQCCGLHSAAEWTTHNEYTEGTYPPSCCSFSISTGSSVTICKTADAVPETHSSYVQMPCMQQIEEKADANLLICRLLVFIYILLISLFLCLKSDWLKTPNQGAQEQRSADGSTPFVVDMNQEKQQLSPNEAV